MSDPSTDKPDDVEGATPSGLRDAEGTTPPKRAASDEATQSGHRDAGEGHPGEHAAEEGATQSGRRQAEGGATKPGND
jgi:hypothetical protein